MVKKASELDLGDEPAREARLFLVDGNSLAYRAFFALPEDFATSEGFPTGALFGFARMLMKMLQDYRPQGVVVCWDEKPTERLALHEGYKASRRPTPELLKEQRPYFPELVDAFGYRNLSVEGREADDVIGTLTRIADEHGVPTCIVSTDRDAFQLVSERVCLMMTPRGFSEVLVYTPARVAERLGVPHTAVPDLIGLKGDTSDDIPGVPGIGDKTAADLLARFGTLEGVYEHLDEIAGPKRKQSLVEHREEAFRSRELGTIVRDIPELTDFDPAAELDRPPDRAKLAELFRRWEMHDLLRRLEDLDESLPPLTLEGAAQARTGPVERGRGADLTELQALLADADEAGIAVHEGLCAIAVADGARVVPADLPGLVDLLDGPALIAHDAKRSLRALGAERVAPAFDTALAAYLLDPGRSGYAFDDLLREHALRVEADGEGADAVREALGVRLLRPKLTERLRERRLLGLLADLELPLVPVLAEMERVGIAIDAAVLGAIADRCAAEVAELEGEAHRLAGGEFALGSPKQLGEVLFGTLGLPVEKSGKTGPSTDRTVLAKLRDQHPIIAVIERWRELSKLLSTYLRVIPEAADAAGRVHTTFSQHTAATGRLSSTNPNLQAIPVRSELGREIRAAFVAPPGRLLVSCDYSQVELRILAALSGEPGLVDAFRRGDDVHRATAAEVLGKNPADVTKDERDRAKAVNFGIIYGISAFGLSEQLEIPRDEAQGYIDTYLGRYPAVRAFIDATIAETEQRGYALTLLGRQRPIPELRARNRQVRQLGERLAVNSLIQGSAADIIKLAMIACDRRLRDEGRDAALVLQIHDELLFEAAEAVAEEIRRIAVEEMVAAHALDPPLVAEAGIGPTWAAAKG
ncbi:MAG: DNA polymerase I [Actinobacteria bacterium]|nr:DNA polymerase I [Actinomycetota bacterium]